MATFLNLSMGTSVAPGTLNGTDTGGPRKVVPSLALRWPHPTGATQAT